jgi:hypothetical protein
MCMDNRSCAGLDMSAPYGPELSLDVTTPQRLHIDESTKQAPELHLAVSGQQEPVQVYTIEA